MIPGTWYGIGWLYWLASKEQKRIEYGASDGVSLLRLCYKKSVASALGDLSYSLPCSEGSQLPCCELPCWVAAPAVYRVGVLIKEKTVKHLTSMLPKVLHQGHGSKKRLRNHHRGAWEDMVTKCHVISWIWY